MKNKNIYSRGCRSDHTRVATTRVLTRLITFLSMIQDKATLTEINKNLHAIKKNRVKDALHFLRANKIVERESDSGQYIYKLNEDWKELRE